MNQEALLHTIVSLLNAPQDIQSAGTFSRYIALSLGNGVNADGWIEGTVYLSGFTRFASEAIVNAVYSLLF